MSDAAILIKYDARKKSKVAGYLLWLFLGGLGAHRFYMGKWKTGILMGFTWLFAISLSIALTLEAFETGNFGTASLPFALFGIWLIADAFFLAGWINRHNEKLIRSLTALDDTDGTREAA